jgi:hypothetical protein
MFKRLVSATILNSIITFRRNSPETKTDPLKFRVNLVQTVLEHGRGVEGIVPGCHSTDKTLPHLIERHFPKRIPPPKRKKFSVY